MSGGATNPTRIWRFANAEYNEARRELRVANQPQTVEAKPLALLYELLCRGGEVATKQELLDAVWPGLTVVDQSLTTAISKLRAALGTQGRTIVEAVHGIGYRIGVPVELRAAPEKPRLAFTLRAGEPVPNRPQWCLDRAFGTGQSPDVWLARHPKTGEQRVFKFADTAQRLEALRREAALSRILHAALGDQPGFVRISEWNFETRPYFIESAYAGPDLIQWTQARGGLSTFSINERIGIVASIARIVAAAHGVGVLHRDIKPTNILVADGEGGPSFRLVDFGSGRLTEAARLQAVTVTGLGLTAGAAAEGERISGTLRYMAPEVLAGGPPTIAADVYALGILLYQMIVSDFDRSLGAGWETDVSDSLLRADVGSAASADADRRLSSAALLAERLENLQPRRREQDQLNRLEEQANYLATQVERGRLRRPWLMLAAASLILGLAGTSVSAIRARRAQDEAQRQAATVLVVNQFLTDDLLGRGNPAISGNLNETLIGAAQAAEPMIEQRFARQPALAAAIYITLTKAFDARGAFEASRKAYDRAQAILTQTEGPKSAEVAILRLRRAVMEATANQTGSLERSKDLVNSVEPWIGQVGPRKIEASAWLLYAEAKIEVMAGDVRDGSRDFAAAGNLADSMPDAFDAETRFNIRRRQGFTLMRWGHYGEARSLLSRLLYEQNAIHGPLHADTLMIGLDLAAISLESGRPDLAVKSLNNLIPAVQSIFGSTNEKTTMALGERASAYEILGQYSEAERDGLDASRNAAAEEGKTSINAFGNLAIVGECECRQGHIQKGLEIMRDVYGTSKATLGEAQPMTQSLKLALGECLVLGNYSAEAEPILDSVDCNAQAGFSGDPELCATVDILKGGSAVERGDKPNGRRLLQGALKHFSIYIGRRLSRTVGPKSPCFIGHQNSALASSQHDNTGSYVVNSLP